MGGANYMGGRINAAKARVRDADGRLQRNHFGRQKLSVLSRGLNHTVGERLKAQPLRRNDAMHQIELAHARRDGTGVPDKRENNMQDDTCSHIRDSSTSSRRQRLSSGNSSSDRSSSSKLRPSKVLSELDLSEPISMRAEISRLLDHPDFAGLSQKPTRSVYSESSDSARSKLSTAMDKLDSPAKAHTNAPKTCDAMNFLDPPFSPVRVSSTRRNLQTDQESSSEDEMVNAFQHNRHFSLQSVGGRDSPFAYNLLVGNLEAPHRVDSERISGSDVTAVSSSHEISPHGHMYNPGSDSTVYSRSTGYLGSSERQFDGPETAFYSPDHEALYSPETLDYMQTAFKFRPAFDVHFSDNEFILSPGLEDTQHFASPVAEYHVAAPLSMSTGYTADSSIGGSRSPPDASSDTVVQETLFDAVHGRLFQPSDPWHLIKTRFEPAIYRLPEDAQSMATSTMFLDLAFANDRTGVGYNLSLASEMPTIITPSKETIDEIDNVSIADTGSPRARSMILTPTMNATPISSSYLPCSAESFMPLSLSSNPSSASASPLGSQRSPTPPLFAFMGGNANHSETMTPIKTPATFVDEPEITAVLGEDKTFIKGPSLFFDNDEDEDD